MWMGHGDAWPPLRIAELSRDLSAPIGGVWRFFRAFIAHCTGLIPVFTHVTSVRNASVISPIANAQWPYLLTDRWSKRSELPAPAAIPAYAASRSEERRVGTECRS